MLIRSLFPTDRDPTRPLNEVVNAEERIDVRSEIDEYVFTDHTRQHLRELGDAILDTGQGNQPDALRAWISGFFGSGKSHFLKLAATLFANQQLVLPDGRSVPALQYAVEKLNLDLAWQRLAADFRIRCVTVNLATAIGGVKQAQDQPLLFRLMSDLQKLGGYSAVPHIAEVEREIKKAKKWDAFLGAVRAESQRQGDVDSAGSPREWESPELRDLSFNAHLMLQTVLPSLLPKFTDAAVVRKYLQDAEAHKPTPDAVVQLAVRAAEEADPTYGRVILCVDEVALYLAGHEDRVREVQGIAETVRNKGKNRVFLWVTAQQRVDAIDAKFAGQNPKIGFLRDRFPSRLPIEERDIDEVVRERWLRKDPKSACYATLQRMVHDHGGLLARAAQLRQENLVRDTQPLTDETAVLAYYPCLPYHIRLIQEILRSLRSDKEVDQTAAQNRALLTTVRLLFVRQNGANLAEAEAGSLNTFDKVYDVIRSAVQKVDSGTDQWIAGGIEDLGSCGEVRISAVAKVILLLQRLNPPDAPRIVVDEENIAALLYPRLGAQWEPHLKSVRDACAKLLTQYYVGQDPKLGYRFYRQEEKTFQKEVDLQPVDDKVFYEKLRSAVADKAAALGMKTYAAVPWQKLPIEVTVHAGGRNLPDPNAAPEGLALHFVWALPKDSAKQAKLWAAQYMAAPHLAIFYLTDTAQVDSLLRRALQLEAAIDAYAKRYGQQVMDFLRNEQKRKTTLLETDIPAAVAAAIDKGTLIARGVDTTLGNQKATVQEVVKSTLKEAVDQVYTQIEIGQVQVDDGDLRKLLRWAPPQAMPDFVNRLKLFDAAARPLTDRAFLKEIQLAIKSSPEKDRTGVALLQHFQNAPYGWPERAVKAGLATLLRGRLVAVKLADGTTLRKADDDRVEGWLLGTQLFNKSIFEGSDITLTFEERQALTQLFADVFGRPGLDTAEKLEKVVDDVVGQLLARAREAYADLHGRQLPGARLLSGFVALVSEAQDSGSQLGRLKTLLSRAVGKQPATAANAIAAMKPAVDLLAVVDHLRTRRLLDSLAAVRRRVDQLYPAWAAALASSRTKIAADWKALADLVVADRIVADADAAIDRDARCFAAYADDYRSAHERRHTRAASALASLAGHAAWASAPAREQLENPIHALDCAEPADLALPATSDGVCPGCRAAIEKLIGDLERIELREQHALRHLDEIASPEPQPTGEDAEDAVVMVVASAEALPELFDRIRAASRRVLASPKRVRVTFEDPT